MAAMHISASGIWRSTIPALLLAAASVPWTGMAAACGPAAATVWHAPRSVGAVEQAWPLAGPDHLAWTVGDPQVVAAPGGGTLTAVFPEGSINPGNDAAPRGGMGFYDRFDTGDGAAGCLSYEVRFDDGFDFARGGKLPGLFGGTDNAGCAPASGRGFSTRYMWSREGMGLLYAYFADRQTRCGTPMGRGTFRFEPGRWHRIQQHLVLNRIGQADGRISIWFDGRLVFLASNLMVRDRGDVAIEGLMFSTFFGGSDPSWASPRDQSIAFRNFTYSVSQP